jgi:hypothetical protein
MKQTRRYLILAIFLALTAFPFARVSGAGGRIEGLLALNIQNAK